MIGTGEKRRISRITRLAVAVRQAEVEEHEIRPVAAGLERRRAGALRLHDAVVLRLEQGAEHRADHGSSSTTSTRYMASVTLSRSAA